MAKTKSQTIDVVKLTEDRVEFCILGRTPLIINRISEKAKRELLLPAKKKTAAEKKTSLKHDPYQEFYSSPYLSDDPKSETFLQAPAIWFKKAIAGAALDIPGATKASIGRLSWVAGKNDPEFVDLYGIPKLRMDEVRNSDMRRTPDIRTRACLRDWACVIVVSFVTPTLDAHTVTNLLAAGGIINGVGDWRQQKGSASFGQFELVEKDDPRFLELTKIGRASQEKAMDNIECYNQETEDLLTWFDPEVNRRGFKVAQ